MKPRTTHEVSTPLGKRHAELNYTPQPVPMMDNAGVVPAGRKWWQWVILAPDEYHERRNANLMIREYLKCECGEEKVTFTDYHRPNFVPGWNPFKWIPKWYAWRVICAPIEQAKEADAEIECIKCKCWRAEDYLDDPRKELKRVSFTGKPS